MRDFARVAAQGAGQNAQMGREYRVTGTMTAVTLDRFTRRVKGEGAPPVPARPRGRPRKTPPGGVASPGVPPPFFSDSETDPDPDEDPHPEPDGPPPTHALTLPEARPAEQWMTLKCQELAAMGRQLTPSLGCVLRGLAWQHEEAEEARREAKRLREQDGDPDELRAAQKHAASLSAQGRKAELEWWALIAAESPRVVR